MNEEELLKRSAEERDKIFARYELGRAEGAEIDPWEDPAFEVYHTTDRLGFIHSERLPSKHDAHEHRRIQQELARTKKWVKMLGSWDSPGCQEKLHKRVYKGVPNIVRSQVWLKLLKVDSLRIKHPNVYKDMFALAKAHSTDARQIDSDVNRQFREHVHYRERYSIKQQSLFNVLTAYAMYNSEVGYCQGMSGLAGVLLMYMDEEQAFWAMHILLADPKYAMHGLYKEGFPKLTRFLDHHDRIFNRFLTKLKRHFDKHGLDAILYSLKWYFVCFVERVPFHLCLRIWDIYFLDGERVIIAMAYTILKLHKKKLMKLNDMDSITHYLQAKLYKDFQYDEDFTVTALEASMLELRKAQMDLPMAPPSRDEVATRPYGLFTAPTLDKMAGIRASSFTHTERETNNIVALRSEQTREEVMARGEVNGVGEGEEEEEREAGSRLSVGTESCEHADSPAHLTRCPAHVSLRQTPVIQRQRQNIIPLHPVTKSTNLSLAPVSSVSLSSEVLIESIKSGVLTFDSIVAQAHTLTRDSDSYLQYSADRTSRYYNVYRDKSKKVVKLEHSVTFIRRSKFSFEPSMDDGSSLIDGDHTGSRRSLADTSVTSTADLSVFSTLTRSHQHENSVDTHSNVSDNSVGGGSSVGSSGIGGNARHDGIPPPISRPLPPPPPLSFHSTTPRNTPLATSPDVLRIYVPYSPLDTPIASPQNGDIHSSNATLAAGIGNNKYTYNTEGNRIRIRIDTDELSTPIVEHGQIMGMIGADELVDMK